MYYVPQPMLCAGVTTYAALRRSQARSGQWVVISGAGGGLGTFVILAHDVPLRSLFSRPANQACSWHQKKATLPCRSVIPPFFLNFKPHRGIRQHLARSRT